MDFFEHQAQAKRSTGHLIILLGVALVAMAAAIYGVAIFAEWLWFHYRPASLWRWSAPIPVLWQPRLLGAIFAGTFVMIAGGSWSKMRQLGAGGGSVALMLGGRQVLRATQVAQDRQLINIVEEMAIAAGLPMPYVFVLDEEPGINAFAAGFTHDDAAVVVTRGALTLLNRDELQGVIAHEFSHLLHGDMRINTRLIALLHGVLAVSGAGLIVIRLGMGGRGDSRKGGVWLALVGALLWLIGSVGLLCGKVIRAAVSRQRELLADASAVQYTRNPSGLAGALKKIGGAQHGSWIETPHAAELAHLFFSESARPSLWNRLFATHPPLLARVQRLDPEFTGNWPQMTMTETTYKPAGGESAAQFAAPAGLYGSDLIATSAATLAATGFTARIGTLSADQLTWGRALIDAVPQPLQRATEEPFGAVSLVLAMLLDANEAVRLRQVSALKRLVSAAIATETVRNFSELSALDPRLRLPLVELALPSLRSLSAPQQGSFSAAVQHLSEADGQRSVFEYTLHHLLLRRLLARPSVTATPQLLSVRHVTAEACALLSALAWVGHPEDIAAAALAFGRATTTFPPMWLPHIRFSAADACNFDAVDAALARLDLATPVAKRTFLNAAATCVMADGRLTVEEGEMLRGIAEALRCPAPPFLPSMLA